VSDAPNPLRRPAEAEPDPAALDELLRAFGVEVPGDEVADDESTQLDQQVDELLADDGTDAGPDGVDAVQEPVPDPVSEEEPETESATGPETESATGPETESATAPETESATGPETESATGPETVEPAPDTGGAPTVISIADDELPDPVYISGELNANPTPGGAVVFIDDDDTGDAVVPDASGTLGRGIEPRLRDRRIAVRRAEGRRRLRWFALAGAVAFVIVGVLAVLGSPLFSIDEVDVTGAVYTDAGQLDSVVADLEGTPVLLVDTRAAERELEAIPWVDTAKVSTSFPRGASIEIRERRPLAAFQGPDGRFRVIDRDGRVLDVVDGQPIAYVLVTSPDTADVEAGSFAREGYAAAAELVLGLTPSVRGRTASIDVTADGSQLRLFLDDGTEVRFGAANDLITKLVRLETVLGPATEAGATVIDVSTAEVTIR
jgi:cell division protein FtsQ